MARTLSRPRQLDRAKTIDDLTDSVLARLRKVIDKGEDKDAIAAARLVLDRSMPALKQSAMAIGVVSAGATHLESLMATARKRLTVGTPDITDATFAPLTRVETSE